MSGNFERDGKIAGLRRFPGDPVGGAAHGGDLNVFRNLVAAGSAKRDGGGVFAREGAIDGEWNANRFANDAESRRIETENSDIGEASGAADGYGQHGNAFQTQFGGGGDGGWAFVPIAIRSEDDAGEIFEFFGGGGERIVEIGAVTCGGGGKWLDDDLETVGQRFPGVGVGERGNGVVRSDVGCLLVWLGSTTSRVFMLAESSHRTAMVGFSSGRKSSTH